MMLIVSSHRFSLMPCSATISIILCSVFLEQGKNTHTHICFSLVLFPGPVVLLFCRCYSCILLMLFKIESKQKIINIDKCSLFSFFLCYRVLKYACIYVLHSLFLFFTIETVTTTSAAPMCLWVQNLAKRKMTFALSLSLSYVSAAAITSDTAAATTFLDWETENARLYEEREVEETLFVSTTAAYVSFIVRAFCNRKCQRKKNKKKFDESFECI